MFLTELTLNMLIKHPQDPLRTMHSQKIPKASSLPASPQNPSLRNTRNQTTIPICLLLFLLLFFKDIYSLINNHPKSIKIHPMFNTCMVSRCYMSCALGSWVCLCFRRFGVGGL